MDKKLKSETDNQWESTTDEVANGDCNCGKKTKTEKDNQWTCTNKNCTKK